MESVFSRSQSSMQTANQAKNIELLVKSLQLADFQAISESDEIAAMDLFIKEHAMQY